MINEDKIKAIKNKLDRCAKSFEPDENRIITAQALLESQEEELPSLLDPLIPKLGIGAIVGGSDTGKSALLRQLALAICAGDHEFLGLKLTPTHKSVVFACTEDDQSTVKKLMRKQIDGKGYKSTWENLRFMFDVDTHSLLEKLDQELTQNPADMVILDAFGDLFTKDINKSTEVRKYLDSYFTLAKKHQCVILYLHHTSKRTEYLPPSKNNVMGSQGFESKLRFIFEIRQDPMFAYKKHLCITKANHLASEWKNKSIEMTFDQHLLFSPTGERVAFADLVVQNPADANNENNLQYDVDWKEVFDKRKEIRHTELVKDLTDWYGMS